MEKTSSVNSETRQRSLVKSLTWRVLGIVVLAFITYIITQSWIKTTTITVLHHTVFVPVYYFHERLWERISIQGRRRKIFKALLYELVLGQGILGIITLVVTGSLQQMTFITVTYIWNKLWIYYVWEWGWGHVTWGKR